jgi:predicted ATP-grasp superfamily ATP-dependent carboligase
MILLWGVPGDTPMAQVRAALEQLACPAIFFDQRDLLDTELDLLLSADRQGILRVGPQVIELDSITGVYMRLYNVQQLPEFRELDQHHPSLAHALGVMEALLAWVELTPALIVNRPSAMESNGSKPYQLRLIQQHGFEVPDTLITTDAVAIREFWDRHGTVIYKSISGVRSIITRLTSQHADRLAHVRWCPTQFQEYVPGIDYRVHVVGDELFAAEIISSADDYRYAAHFGATAEVRPYIPSTEIDHRCRTLASALGLAVAGIDLRQRPDGRWYCFEVNPSPAFSYYQNATGQAIDAAIARLLRQSASVSR